MTPPARHFLTPPQVGRQLGVKAARIIGWIRAGRLRGLDLSEPGSRRPSYRVAVGDLELFLNTRAVGPGPRRARRRRTSNITKFF